MDHTKLPFEFSGKTTEYFGIWIVNVLLTIITLGFYTPWAKVRTRRYFYGSTTLDNSAFDYTGDPLAIFKGYLIAILLFICYSIVINFYPPAQFIFIIFLLLIMPWLVIRSMMFRARNTVFRNIRFSFGQRYGQAYKIFSGLPLLLPFTLGLIMPYLVYRQKQFLINNSNFGTSPFSFHAGARDFYKAFALLLVLMILPVIGILAAIAIPAYNEYITAAGGRSFSAQPAETPDVMVIIVTQVIITFVSILFSLMFYAYLEARINNLVWNNVELATHRFSSALRARDLLWIFATNMLAIILSFGLLVPWAKIRLTRYRLGKLSMLATSSLDGFVKREQEKAGAVGEEIGELFDIDIGL